MKIHDEFKRFTHWAVAAIVSLDGAVQAGWQHIAAFQQYLSPRLLSDVSIGMLIVALVVHYAPRKTP